MAKRKPNKDYFIEILEDRSMSQNELARKLEVKHSTMSRWLNGERDMSLDVASEIAEILRVPLFDIIANGLNYPEVIKPTARQKKATKKTTSK